jgi:transposase
MSENDFKTSETMQPQEASPVKHPMSVLGIDIAKRLFHVVGMNERGQIVLRKRLARNALRPCIATLPPVLIGMEACGGAHDWARRFRAHHHEVKRMAPQFVKPSIKSNKNDMRDAEGIGEAVTRPTMRFVPTKDVDQQDIQALQRVRERLRGARTALVHERHGLLHE